MSFVRFHIGSVESIGLLTPSGTSPIIEVETVECVTPFAFFNLLNPLGTIAAAFVIDCATASRPASTTQPKA